MKVDALVLAGGETNGKLRTVSGVNYEAMILIAGKPMVTYVVAALEQSGQVERIFVIGPADQLRDYFFSEKVILLPGGSSLLDNITRGMAAANSKRKILLATADIPLLTGQAVAYFLDQCERREADLYYPVLAKKQMGQSYPGNDRTYVHLCEGDFTGGNLFLVNPLIVPRCIEQAKYLIGNRKRPLALCRFLGILFLMRFLVRKLSLQAVERRASELLAIEGAVLEFPFSEVGMDVDKPSDLALVEELFQKRNHSLF